LLSTEKTMATLEKVQAQIMKLQAQADALIVKKSSAVIGKIRALMAEHGLTTADIDAHVGGKKRGPKSGAKSVVVVKASAAKYQDPKTGATWSGHGRAPGWLANAKDRTKYLVNSNASDAASGTASKAKPVDNYLRGPQPAMYRDPKSGATWSGRGRAPAWLAGARDRSRFLIDGASASVAATTTSKPKAAAKKPATKTAVAKKAPAKKAVVAKKVGATMNVAAAPEAAAA
jgi:DNA-binding protein H-NS